MFVQITLLKCPKIYQKFNFVGANYKHIIYDISLLFYLLTTFLIKNNLKSNTIKLFFLILNIFLNLRFITFFFKLEKIYFKTLFFFLKI